MIDRRAWTAAMLGALTVPARAADPAAPGDRILRVPFEEAETGFDPARTGDIYSARVNAHIFEAPFHYDLFALPVKVRPLTAAALPEVSADYRVWTIRITPGIHFADDPAFKGRPRELTAQDYLYSIQRFIDPANKSPAVSQLLEEGIEGLDQAYEAAVRSRKRFDYDAPIAGLRLLDRYTLQIGLRAPRPRFVETNLCSSAQMGALAREVVEFYGEEIPAHPVGTGPYRLKEWRRSSRIVLERNPTYREVLYDGEPNADDPDAQALLARYKGRRLPLNDGVEISVLTEGQSRWLSFLNGIVDYVRVPAEFSSIAVPGGHLAPNLARRKITLRRYVNCDFTMSYFNMDDPVVGGYTPEKVALRRAMALAYDTGREIRIARRGSGIAAQAAMPPGTYGYDPKFRSENGDYDPARAKALLDIYGYLDRNGDGWREQPDGSPLVIRMGTQTSSFDRQVIEIWQKSLAAIGIRIRFDTAQWPENYKAARAGRLQMWVLGSTASTPDAQQALETMYGPSAGSQNLARFKLPAFDRLYERMQNLPNGPERAALFIAASKLAVAYMPYKIHVHRIYNDLSQPWITGWRQAFFRNEQWQFVEVDAALRARTTA